MMKTESWEDIPAAGMKAVSFSPIFNVTYDQGGDRGVFVG